MAQPSSGGIEGPVWQLIFGGLAIIGVGVVIYRTRERLADLASRQARWMPREDMYRGAFVGTAAIAALVGLVWIAIGIFGTP